jgi:ADP-heptose:LPS heptosyltransferase
MSQTRGKILVIRGGAIGDFILTLPALAALREQFPQTHVELLGYPHIAQLALAGGLVDRLRSIEARALAGFFARSGPLDPDLREYFASFDVVISYLYDPDEIFRTNVGSCSKAQFLAGAHRPDEKSNIHATDLFLKPLERLAIYRADPVPRLNVRDASGPPGPRAHLKGPSRMNAVQLRAALHPGSGSEKKNWPEARWVQLMERLASATNWTFLLAGGEAEGKRLDHLARLVPPGRVDIAHCLPLAELAVQLQQCDVFLGHDSGISHLSAALGLRVLVLWGETNPAIWRPRGDRISLLSRGDGLAQLEVEAVWSAVLQLEPPDGVGRDTSCAAPDQASQS